MKLLYEVEVCVKGNDEDCSCFAVVAESIERVVVKVNEHLAALNSNAVIVRIELLATEDNFESLLIVDDFVSEPVQPVQP